MRPAALSLLLCGGLALSAAGLAAAETGGRSAPLRPGAVVPAVPPPPAPPPPATGTAKKSNSGAYVSADDLAAQLGLKATSSDRGRRVTLVGSGARAELEKDSREATVNGLRVFLGEPVTEKGGQLQVSRIDFERCLTPLLRPGRGATPRPPAKVVVLDPGHGGKDNGTSANEKTFTLDVARRAKKILESSGLRVELTRDSDVFLDLPQRSAVAVARKADLFASIHFNALPNDTRTSGVEIFTFAPQYQRSTNSWGPRESGDAEKEAAPVNRFDHWSVVLAQSIHRRFVNDLKSFDRGKKLAHWGVLRALNCPGVLVECGFLTSQEEARKIATPAHRQKIAETIAAGIRDYLALTERTRLGGAAKAATGSGPASS